MSKRSQKKILTQKEASLAKAMFLYTDKNNQQILSYFICPGNDINSRVMTQLRKNEIHQEVEACSKSEMDSFIRERENQTFVKNPSEENSVVLYQVPGQNIELSVNIDSSKETVWLTQTQMAQLFDKDFNTINEHILNIYNECELEKESTSRDFREVRKEGNRTVSRSVSQYNLDVIISVGYRVKSFRGTQFRIWANRVLKQYLIEGYALNQRVLNEEQGRKLKILQQAVSLIQRGFENQTKTLEEAKNLLQVLSDFSDGLALLDDFDNKQLDEHGATEKEAVKIDEDTFLKIINQMKPEYGSEVFANPKDDSFNSSVNQIYQTFGGKECYPTLEEKAGMLLYLIVKNHSFTDGNKRIAACCFLYFMEQNGMLYQNGTTLIDNATLATMTLLIAESKAEEMETMKKIVVSVLNRKLSESN